MPIDMSGEFWKGSSAADLLDFLRNYAVEHPPAARVLQARCTCGSTAFRVDVDLDRPALQRTCAACDRLLLEGGRALDSADGPLAVSCPCGQDTYELAAAFSPEEASGRQVTFGLRCTGCGVLGTPVEWPITAEEAPQYEAV